MLVTKQLLVAIDFHSMEEILGTSNRLVTNNLSTNVSFLKDILKLLLEKSKERLQVIKREIVCNAKHYRHQNYSNRSEYTFK